MPEVEALVMRRRTDVKDYENQDQPPSFDRSTTAVMKSSPHRIRKLEARVDGRLTARLIKSDSSSDNRCFFNTIPIRAKDLDKLSQHEISVTQAKSVFVESETEAFVCKEARAGHYLMDLGLMIVVKPTSSQLLSSDLQVARAIPSLGRVSVSENYYLCDCMVSCAQHSDALAIDPSIKMAAEVALVLAAQDIICSNPLDLLARYGRLRTRITEYLLQSPFEIVRFHQ